MLAGSREDYLLRYVDLELDELIGQLPAIALEGAKGVGKTVTAMRRVGDVLYLDEPSERQLLEAVGRDRLRSFNSVCVDEWQLYPPVWDMVRRLVDQGDSTRFMLTGSATPIVDVNTHSGAGRIVALKMRPLALSERAHTRPTVQISELFAGNAEILGSTDCELADYAQAICQTGLPGFQDLHRRALRSSIEGYVQRIIDRDVAELGHKVRKIEALRAWLKAFAAATSTTTSYTKILDAATPGDVNKPSKSAANSYREILSKIWVLDSLPAWLPSAAPLTRLVQGPKLHLLDPGIAAHELGLSPEILLSGAKGTGEIFGQLFESLALLTIRGAAQACEAKAYHLRTRGGQREIDVLIERFDGRVIAFEVKIAHSVTDRDVAHLHWLKEQLGARLVDQVIVTTGKHAFRRPDGIAVIPLALLA